MKLINIIEDLEKDLNKDTVVKSVFKDIQAALRANSIRKKTVGKFIDYISLVPNTTKRHYDEQPFLRRVFHKPLEIIIYNNLDQSKEASYDFKKNNIEIHLRNLKLSLEYKEETQEIDDKFLLNDSFINALRHELIHYLDYENELNKNTRVTQFKKATDAGNSKGFSADYLSTPVEFNAFFIQYLMPTVQKSLEGTQNLGTFKEFVDKVFQEEGFNQFISTIKSNPDYYKKFLKRMGSYYIQLRDILKFKDKLDQYDLEKAQSVLTQAA